MNIKRGDLIETCHCEGCGLPHDFGAHAHPCGGKDCNHAFGFALEDETKENETFRAQFKGAIRSVHVNDVVAYAWGGWIPEEIIDLYEAWFETNGPEDDHWDEYF